jgi:tRNA nucleotidyltransferase/poly(A) polymerase
MPEGTNQGRAITSDFVLCRKDGAYSDGRHPEVVSVGTIYDDLKRRDFTINALAKDEAGIIIDPHGGKVDLEAGILKCVGDPRDRFSEDGLRMIRAIRFAVTKELEIHYEIDGLLQDEDFFKPRLKGVSIERIREELTKAFSYDTPATINELIYFSDLRRYLFSLKGLWLKPTTELR